MTRARPILHQFHASPDWAKLPLFDRKGWKRVRFGDVVENINETCDPEESGLERFIGLEHLEPGSLHIRKWGDVSDGTTFTRQCRPGQVLFGKRRAYQRKVAVAEFDAVVSGDIYVLAPKNDKLLSQLLPFICLSERFFQHAVGTSAGSLSPRTNWSSLATFEFDLPPLDQQRRIAEILWAVDEVLVEHSSLLSDAQNYKGVLLEWCFSPERSVKIRLGDLCVNKGIRIGPFGSQLHAHEYVDVGIPVVMPANLSADQIVLDEIKRITALKVDELAVHKLEEGDILLPRRGNLKKLGFVHQGQGGWICGTGTIRIRYDLADRRRLLFYALSRPSVSVWLERNAVGTTMPNINSAIVGNIEVYWPENVVEAQRRIEMADDALIAIQDQLAAQQSIFQSLINTMLGTTT
ncbi:MAG: restriction endonuclease subunit S [bacterium]